jgi:mannose-6-phosphate isomerase-like protein (cupin superfamily)
MTSISDECELSIIQVDKPWGWYKTIYSQQGFKIKHICVFPKSRLALHSHEQRSEHWVVVKGNSMVRVGNDEIFLHANQNIFIPTRVLHRIENVGDENLEFVETQIGEYLDDCDVIIYQDDYNRTNNKY